MGGRDSGWERERVREIAREVVRKRERERERERERDQLSLPQLDDFQTRKDTNIRSKKQDRTRTTTRVRLS